MICNLRYLVLAVVFVLTFEYYAYAPWTTSPVEPPITQEETCVGWIFFNGFTDNPETNLDKARTREKKYDKDVSIWAALYASLLTVFHQYLPIDPLSFCRLHISDDAITMTFFSLKNTRKSCIKWIKLFGFKADTPDIMWDLVVGRSEIEDRYISLWPALYAQYIAIDQSRASTSQEEFCRKMGHTNNRQSLPYIAIFDTIKNCREWLDFGGYTNDLEINMSIATKLSEDYLQIMNYFIRFYSRELLSHIFLNFAANPVHTRNLMRNPVEIDVRTPEEFCNGFGDLGKERLPYNYL